MKHHEKRFLATFNLENRESWNCPLFSISLNHFDNVIGINEVLSFKGDKSRTLVHFFVDDYQFERVWNKPELWAEKLRGFAVVLTPDFSALEGLPEEVNLYNAWRSARVGQIWQEAWIDEDTQLVPTLIYTNEKDVVRATRLLAPFGWYAISTTGIRTTSEFERFTNGLLQASKELVPRGLIVFGDDERIPRLAINEILGEEGLPNMQVLKIKKQRGKVKSKWEVVEEE